MADSFSSSSCVSTALQVFLACPVADTIPGTAPIGKIHAAAEIGTGIDVIAAAGLEDGAVVDIANDLVLGGITPDKAAIVVCYSQSPGSEAEIPGCGVFLTPWNHGVIPLAPLFSPPPTTANAPLAVLLEPPLTVACSLLAVLS